MEEQVLNQQVIDATQDAVVQDVRELSQFQLAIIGGGCAEVCPY